MSISDITLRFESAFSKKSKLLSFSLPIFDRENEIIFFYYTDTIENGILIREVTNLFLRNKVSEKITSQDPIDYFRKNTSINPNGIVVSNGIFGEKAFELVEKYYDLYEQILSFAFSADINADQKNCLKEYMNVFLQLIPAGGLRTLYLSLAKELFEYIDKETEQKK